MDIKYMQYIILLSINFAPSPVCIYLKMYAHKLWTGSYLYFIRPAPLNKHAHVPLTTHIPPPEKSKPKKIGGKSRTEESPLLIHCLFVCPLV